MPGLFGMGAPAIVALAVVVLLVVLVVALPAGRGAVAVLVGQVARWPGMIRAEMRGAAPLAVDDGPVDGSVDGRSHDGGFHDGATDPRARPLTGDTTPDIPAVTRGLPVVERAHRR